jgi:hypothetical protein
MHYHAIFYVNYNQSIYLPAADSILSELMFVVDVRLLSSAVLTEKALEWRLVLYASFNSEGTIHWAKALSTVTTIPWNPKTAITNITPANMGLIIT